MKTDPNLGRALATIEKLKLKPMNISDAARELPRFTPYDGDSSLYSDSKRGEWVRYADHVAATAALTLELETVRRERDGLRQIDVPMWVFELAGGESIPAHQILPDKARLTQAEFLPWVSNLLRTLAGERDTLRQQLAEAREDARRLDALDNMANVKIAESNRPDRWMIERDTEAVPNPVRANSIRAAIDAALNPPTDEK